jgi:hypothetical protein
VQGVARITRLLPIPLSCSVLDVIAVNVALPACATRGRDFKTAQVIVVLAELLPLQEAAPTFPTPGAPAVKVTVTSEA